MLASVSGQASRFIHGSVALNRELAATVDPGRWTGRTLRDRATRRPGPSVIVRVCCRWVLFPGRVAGLFEMVRELFFSICASFPNDAHLLRGEVLNADVVSGAAGPPGSAQGRTKIGLFAHIGIFPPHIPR